MMPVIMRVLKGCAILSVWRGAFDLAYVEFFEPSGGAGGMGASVDLA